MLELLGGCLFRRKSMLTRPMTWRMTSALRPLLSGREGLCGVGGTRHVHYEQGQSPKKGIREYFYYIDHQEKKFLQFFFSRIHVNETGSYPEFPFLSLCGRERNYIRCDDLPLVFTHLTIKETPEGTKEEHLAYGNAGETMTMPFQPSELCMQVETGRVYHPAMERVGGVGLVRSKLAIQLSTHFVFGDGDERPPTHIHWGGKDVRLSQSVVPVLESLEHVRRYSMGLEDGAEG